MSRGNHREQASIGGAKRYSSPVADLTRYERPAIDDDYRHRMMANAMALPFIVALILAGVWLTNKLAQAGSEGMHRSEHITTTHAQPG
jgi:hypothetical protein